MNLEMVTDKVNSILVSNAARLQSFWLTVMYSYIQSKKKEIYLNAFSCVWTGFRFLWLRKMNVFCGLAQADVFVRDGDTNLL